MYPSPTLNRSSNSTRTRSPNILPRSYTPSQQSPGLLAKATPKPESKDCAHREPAAQRLLSRKRLRLGMQNNSSLALSRIGNKPGRASNRMHHPPITNAPCSILLLPKDSSMLFQHRLQRHPLDLHITHLPLNTQRPHNRRRKHDGQIQRRHEILTLMRHHPRQMLNQHLQTIPMRLG